MGIAIKNLAQPEKAISVRSGSLDHRFLGKEA